MKKIIFSLLTLSLIAVSIKVNSCPSIEQPFKILSVSTTTTDIFNYMDKGLALTATQKPIVKKAVDEAGAETLKLDADSTKSDEAKKTAKTGVVNALIKQLSTGVLKGTQTTKLAGMANQLITLYAQLK